MKHEPPFDGSAPCPACPSEIRNLIAVVHNYVNRVRGRSTSSDTTIEDLEAAVKAVEPIIEKHFADPAHSHGTLRPL